MIELYFISLAVFVIAMILYCIFFHEKSLHFILSVSWFSVNIALHSLKIYGELSLDFNPNIYITLIYILNSLNFFLFFGIILSYYYRKNKELNWYFKTKSFEKEN